MALVLALLAGAPAARAQESAGGRVLGTVRDSAGLPVAGATVSVEGTELRARSDAAGGFLLTRVAVGEQVLRTTRPGFLPSRTRLTVPAGGVLDVGIAPGDPTDMRK